MNTPEFPILEQARIAVVKEAVRNAIAQSRAALADCIVEILVKIPDGSNSAAIAQAVTEVMAEETSAEQEGSATDTVSLQALVASFMQRLSSIRKLAGA